MAGPAGTAGDTIGGARRAGTAGTTWGELGIFLAPLAVGFCLECRWLIQAGFIVLLVIILGSIGYLWTGEQPNARIPIHLPVGPEEIRTKTSTTASSP